MNQSFFQCWLSPYCEGHQAVLGTKGAGAAEAAIQGYLLCQESSAASALHPGVCISVKGLFPLLFHKMIFVVLADT